MKSTRAGFIQTLLTIAAGFSTSINLFSMPNFKKRNVAIFIFDEAEVLDFAGPFEVFSVTSELRNYEPFRVFTISSECVGFRKFSKKFVNISRYELNS